MRRSRAPPGGAPRSPRSRASAGRTAAGRRTDRSPRRGRHPRSLRSRSPGWAPSRPGSLRRRQAIVLAGDHPRRDGDAGGFGDQALGVAGGAGHEAHVHQVEAFSGQTGVVGVTDHELDIGGRAATAVLQELVVHIEAEDASRGTDVATEVIRDAAGTAADVVAGPAGHVAEAVEHGLGVGRPRLGLHVEAAYFARAVLDGVVAGECFGHRYLTPSPSPSWERGSGDLESVLASKGVGQASRLVPGPAPISD